MSHERLEQAEVTPQWQIDKKVREVYHARMVAWTATLKPRDRVAVTDSIYPERRKLARLATVTQVTPAGRVCIVEDGGTSVWKHKPDGASMNQRRLYLEWPENLSTLLWENLERAAQAHRERQEREDQNLDAARALLPGLQAVRWTPFAVRQGRASWQVLDALGIVLATTEHPKTAELFAAAPRLHQYLSSALDRLKLASADNATYAKILNSIADVMIGYSDSSEEWGVGIRRLLDERNALAKLAVRLLTGRTPEQVPTYAEVQEVLRGADLQDKVESEGTASGPRLDPQPNDTMTDPAGTVYTVTSVNEHTVWCTMVSTSVFGEITRPMSWSRRLWEVDAARNAFTYARPERVDNGWQHVLNE